MNRILLIEDDSSLGKTLKERLEKEKYSVEWSQELKGARELLKSKSFDLIILDIKLPDGSGFDLAVEIKKITSSPLIFVSAMTTAEYRLKGYELGAEEFIPKPFHLKELLLRVRHVLMNHAPEKNLNIRGISVDFEKRAIAHVGQPLEYLQVKDFNILKLLIDVAPRVVSRDEILDLFWGDEKFPSTRTVDNVIVRLRSLLKDEENKLIRSVRGIGYQWIGSSEHGE